MFTVFSRLLFFIALLLSLSWFVSSCVQRQFVPGKGIMLVMKDSVLNDSAVITGRVYESEYPFYPSSSAEVWINDENNSKVNTNTNGIYQLKVVPGSYIIRWQNINNPWKQLITDYPIKIGRNKKLVVDFYLGYTVE